MSQGTGFPLGFGLSVQDTEKTQLARVRYVDDRTVGRAPALPSAIGSYHILTSPFVVAATVGEFLYLLCTVDVRPNVCSRWCLDEKPWNKRDR